MTLDIRTQILYATSQQSNHLLLNLDTGLLNEPYTCQVCNNSQELLKNIESKDPKTVLRLIILADQLDDLSILAALAMVKSRSATPVLVLLSDHQELWKSACYELGCDACIQYKTPYDEIRSIVQNLIRREYGPIEKNGLYPINDRVELCELSMGAFIDGKRVELTLLEFKVMHYLAINKNRAVSRKELLESVWGYTHYCETRATDDLMKRLRKKLCCTQGTLNIETIRGFGFLMRDFD